MFEALDSVSRSGSADRPNEDRLAHGETFGLVIDGATGLGDARLLAESGSDAAWLAEIAAELISARIAAAPDLPALIRSVNSDLRERLAAGMARRPSPGPRRPEEAPRYALPTAAFQLLRRLSGVGAGGEGKVALETAGLGDCALFLVDADGGFHRASGLNRGRAMEQQAARAALDIVGGLGGAQAFLRRPEVLERLREARSAHNTPYGVVWTLGITPEAGDHLGRERFFLRPPALALLATDGFADLVDLYGDYDGAGLLQAAANKGLAPLADRLRDIETRVDPDGRRYPRFKRSDDATALLLRIH